MKMVRALVILLDQKPEEPAKTNNANPAAPESGGNKKNTTDLNPVRKNRRITEGTTKAAPRETKIFYLKYAEAEFLSNLIKEVYHDVEKSGRVGIAVDPRTNSIIISSESKSSLDEFEALIQAIDRKQDQNIPVKAPGSGTNPFGFPQRQVGERSKTSSTIRQLAAGQPTDLIRLTESYSDAYKELQLAAAAFSGLQVQVKQKPQLMIELTKAQVEIDAAKRKLDLLKQIAKAEINSTEAEIKDISEQISAATSRQIEKGLKRQLSQQQHRLEILKQLISR